MNNPVVFVALPSYDGFCNFKAFEAGICKPTLPGSATQTLGTARGNSILIENFNELWVQALNLHLEGKVSHFAMLHADIAPEEGWVDTLLSIMLNEEADVVSAVVPIKSDAGITSTAIGHPTNPWQVIKRLTMHEVHKLPPIFDATDCGFPGHPLLINTGCWLADLSRPWVGDFSFETHSAIRRNPQTDRFETVRGRSEDWELGRFLHKVGAKVLATRAVRLDHVGTWGFTNAHPWGEYEVDPYYDAKRFPSTEKD